jgi:hypothetical protein
MMPQPEFKIQADAIIYLKLHYPKLLVLTSPMAGARMTPGMGMKMVRMGYQKGTPDLTILKPMPPYFGLLVEIKAPGGKLSDVQKWFLRDAAAEGYKTAVAWSYEELIRTVEDYLSSPF